MPNFAAATSVKVGASLCNTRGIKRYVVHEGERRLMGEKLVNTSGGNFQNKKLLG